MKYIFELIQKHLCKHQGHIDSECTVKQREEEHKRRKEIEARKNQQNTKNKENKEQQQDNLIVQEQKVESSHNKAVVMHQNRPTDQQQQEEQWQTQKRKSNNQLPAQKGIQRETDQQISKQTGMISIPNYNTIIDLDMQEQTNSQVEAENQQAKKNATLNSQVASEPVLKSTMHNMIPMDQQSNELEGQNRKISGIDSVLPKSQNPFSILADFADEVEGGMDGGCQEKPTNLQEGMSKGGNLTHVLHKVAHTDHRPDLRTPATTPQVPTKQNNN
ncbi:hypothetical protein R3W88_024246 [Solanum pinnatisectum]|uniref:Uncharacterized protein n=1 Tax=Solanum pinnatisectum TaxID=50273 RepID=A0AAV9LZQ9_9SOLN|nr:hypothetical protein R3W88_024246 [Solanum pinnatisectum]